MDEARHGGTGAQERAVGYCVRTIAQLCFSAITCLLNTDRNNEGLLLLHLPVLFASDA